MQTITVELLDEQAIGLLQQLEKIQWLRIVRKPASKRPRQRQEARPTPEFQDMTQQEFADYILKQLEEMRRQPRPKKFLSDLETLSIPVDGLIIDRGEIYEDRIQHEDIR